MAGRSGRKTVITEELAISSFECCDLQDRNTYTKEALGIAEADMALIYDCSDDGTFEHNGQSYRLLRVWYAENAILEADEFLAFGKPRRMTRAITWRIGDAEIVDEVSSVEMECARFCVAEERRGAVVLDYRGRHKRVLDMADENGGTRYRRRDAIVTSVTYGDEYRKTFSFDEYTGLGRPKKIRRRKLIEYTPL